MITVHKNTILLGVARKIIAIKFYETQKVTLRVDLLVIHTLLMSRSPFFFSKSTNKKTWTFVSHRENQFQVID